MSHLKLPKYDITFKLLNDFVFHFNFYLITKYQAKENYTETMLNKGFKAQLSE